MPDMTMCAGVNRVGLKCPMRTACERHTATPSERQSYFSVAPFGGYVDEQAEQVKFFCEHYRNNGTPVEAAAEKEYP